MFAPPFLFLCKLAWAARYRIPIIITVLFIVFDVHMQVEINVEMRTIRREPVENNHPLDLDLEDDILEGSWITIEDGDLTLDDETDSSAFLLEAPILA